MILLALVNKYKVFGVKLIEKKGKVNIYTLQDITPLVNTRITYNLTIKDNGDIYDNNISVGKYV